MKGQPLSWPPSRPLAIEVKPTLPLRLSYSVPWGVGGGGGLPSSTALWVQNEKREIAHLVFFHFLRYSAVLLAFLYQRNSAKKAQVPTSYL